MLHRAQESPRMDGPRKEECTTAVLLRLRQTLQLALAALPSASCIMQLACTFQHSLLLRIDPSGLCGTLSRRTYGRSSDSFTMHTENPEKYGCDPAWKKESP